MSYRRSKGHPVNHDSCFVHKAARAASPSARWSAAVPALPPLLCRSMSDVPAPAMTFTAAERDYIRREFDMFFSTFLTVAEGFQLKMWRGGAQAGQPRVCWSVG
jgi:hypothetical protein